MTSLLGGSALSISVVLIGVISRLIPHPPNLTAIGAVGLFLGVYSKKKNLFFIANILILLLVPLIKNLDVL